MAGIFNGPPRGGTRGGRDQFNWDNVKADKEREYYLGHSVKALTGRWQKGRDVYWYTRDVERSEADKASELAMVKQREQDLMMEALGVKPKAPKQLKQPQLDKLDMQKLLQGNGEEDEKGGGAGAMAATAIADADRIKGLGFHASMTTGAIQAGTDHETLAGMGGRSLSGPGTGAQQPPAASRQQRQQQQQAGGVPGAMLTEEQIAELKQLHKKQDKDVVKKARKKAKKEAKKAKKKAKKEKKKSKRHSSSSNGGRTSSKSEGEGADAQGRQPTSPPMAVHGLALRRGLGMGQRVCERERQHSRNPAYKRRRPNESERELQQEPARRRSRSQSPAGGRRRRHDSPS